MNIPRKHSEEKRKEFAEHIRSRIERRKEGIRQKKEHDPVKFGLGMLGILGWMVAIPALLLILLGNRLDAYPDGAPTWSVILLFAGIIIGSVNGWLWIKRESRND